MKLCADILYWRLKEELKTVELHGAGSQELTLSRPEFYLDRTQTFEKNRVYVCSADHLPARPSLQRKRVPRLPRAALEPERRSMTGAA